MIAVVRNVIYPKLQEKPKNAFDLIVSEEPSSKTDLTVQMYMGL